MTFLFNFLELKFILPIFRFTNNHLNIIFYDEVLFKYIMWNKVWTVLLVYTTYWKIITFSMLTFANKRMKNPSQCFYLESNNQCFKTFKFNFKFDANYNRSSLVVNQHYVFFKGLPISVQARDNTRIYNVGMYYFLNIFFLKRKKKWEKTNNFLFFIFTLN